MLRHSVLYLHRDNASDDEKSSMLRGLAYLGMEFPSVCAGDYGDDIAGGSQRLLDVPPWTRPPRFRARGQGPPSNFDVALHLDFDDEAGLAAFEEDAAQQPVAAFNAAVTVDELTARVDWRYEGDVPNRRGHVRHCAMHVWRDDADPGTRARVFDAAMALAATPEVESVVVGESAGTRRSDYDWLLDVQFADAAAARSALDGERFAELTDVIAQATKDEWTARVTHLMRGEP
jgi:hypothetical protein